MTILKHCFIHHNYANIATNMDTITEQTIGLLQNEKDIEKRNSIVKMQIAIIIQHESFSIFTDGELFNFLLKLTRFSITMNTIIACGLEIMISQIKYKNYSANLDLKNTLSQITIRSTKPYFSLICKLKKTLNNILKTKMKSIDVNYSNELFNSIKMCINRSDYFDALFVQKILDAITPETFKKHIASDIIKLDESMIAKAPYHTCLVAIHSDLNDKFSYFARLNVIFEAMPIDQISDIIDSVGNYEKAWKLYVAMLDMSRVHSNIIYTKIAECHYRSEQYNESITFFCDLISKKSSKINLGDCYYWIGDAFLRKNIEHIAIDKLISAVNNKCTDIGECCYVIAHYYYKKNMLDDAILYFKKSVDYKYNICKSNFLIGMCYLYKTDYENVFKFFVMAYNDGYACGPMFYWIISICISKKKYDMAIMYRKIASVNRHNIDFDLSLCSGNVFDSVLW